MELYLIVICIIVVVSAFALLLYLLYKFQKHKHKVQKEKHDAPTNTREAYGWQGQEPRTTHSSWQPTLGCQGIEAQKELFASRQPEPIRTYVARNNDARQPHKDQTNNGHIFGEFAAAISA